MAFNEIVVQGALILPKEVNIVASITITTSPDSKWNVDGKKIYKGDIDVLVSGALQGTCLQNAPQTGTIRGDGKWNISNDKLVRNDKDGDVMTIDGTDTVSSNACSFSLTPKIKTSGQTVLKPWSVEHD